MSQTINLGNLRNVRDDTYSFNNESKPSDAITFSTPFENQSTYNMRTTNKPYQKYNNVKSNSINPVDLASKYSAPDDDLMVDLSNYNNKEVLDYQSKSINPTSSTLTVKSNDSYDGIKQQVQLLQQNFKRQVSNYLTNAKHIKNSTLRSINSQLVEIQHKIKNIVQDINENNLSDVRDDINRVKSKLNDVKYQIMKNINHEYFNSSPYISQWSSSGRVQDNIEGFKSKQLKSSSTLSTVISVIIIIVLIILIIYFGYSIYVSLPTKTTGGVKFFRTYSNETKLNKYNSKQIYPIPVKTSIKYDSNGKVIPTSKYLHQTRYNRSTLKSIDKRYNSDHKSHDKSMEQTNYKDISSTEIKVETKPSESTKLTDNDKKVLESFGGSIEV